MMSMKGESVRNGSKVSTRSSRGGKPMARSASMASVSRMVSRSRRAGGILACRVANGTLARLFSSSLSTSTECCENRRRSAMPASGLTSGSSRAMMRG